MGAGVALKVLLIAGCKQIYGEDERIWQLETSKKSTWHPSVMMPWETQSVLRRMCLERGTAEASYSLLPLKSEHKIRTWLGRGTPRQAPLSTPGPSLLTTLYLWTQALILDAWGRPVAVSFTTYGMDSRVDPNVQDVQLNTYFLNACYF